MTLRYIAMPDEDACRIWQGGRDAYGKLPERHISDGDGVPCRRCLRNVELGQAYLILAYRPFSSAQPYAETGPIFLHADECPAPKGGSIPPIFTSSREYLLRGYGADERIIYGTGGMVAQEALEQRAEELLARPDVAFVHVRSASASARNRTRFSESSMRSSKSYSDLCASEKTRGAVSTIATNAASTGAEPARCKARQRCAPDTTHSAVAASRHVDRHAVLSSRGQATFSAASGAKAS